jgi:hypothetical protein
MMDQSRRKFFGIGVAVAAAAAVPAIAEAKPTKAVSPILLERICDADRHKMTAEEIENFDALITECHGPDALRLYPLWPGCGTKFQWYFGGGYPYCPNCGRAYQMTLEMLKSGKYNAPTA